MHKNFAMMVLQMVSHTRAEACPPPCMNTTNKLPPFGHPFAEFVIIQQERVENTGPSIGSSMTELLILQQHRANSVGRIDPYLHIFHGKWFYRPPELAKHWGLFRCTMA